MVNTDPEVKYIPLILVSDVGFSQSMTKARRTHDNNKITNDDTDTVPGIGSNSQIWPDEINGQNGQQQINFNIHWEIPLDRDQLEVSSEQHDRSTCRVGNTNGTTILSDFSGYGTQPTYLEIYPFQQYLFQQKGN